MQQRILGRDSRSERSNKLDLPSRSWWLICVNMSIVAFYCELRSITDDGDDDACSTVLTAQLLFCPFAGLVFNFGANRNKWGALAYNASAISRPSSFLDFLGCCNIACISPSVAEVFALPMRLIWSHHASINSSPPPIRSQQVPPLKSIFPFWVISQCDVKVTYQDVFCMLIIISMYLCKSNKSCDEHFILICL